MPLLLQAPGLFSGFAQAGGQSRTVARLQTTRNSDSDVIDIPNSKERTVGLGSGIQLGGQGIWFRVNSYIETDVRNRPSGVKVTL